MVSHEGNIRKLPYRPEEYQIPLFVFEKKIVFMYIPVPFREGVYSPPFAIFLFFFSPFSSMRP